jgi:hypothetical protein
MKKLMKLNHKYLIFKKKSFCLKNSYKCVNSIVTCLVDKVNLSNTPRYFIGDIDVSTNLLEIISSKIIISFSDKLPTVMWEIISGRSLRNIFKPCGAPKKMFYDGRLGLIITISIKKILVYSINRSTSLNSVPVEPIFPLKVQLIRKTSTLVIFGKPNHFYFINYQKGYFIRKFEPNSSSALLNGIGYRSNDYFLVNKQSINLYSVYRKSFRNFSLTRKRYLNFGITDLKNVILNSPSKYFDHLNISIVLSVKKYYLLDYLTRLLLFDNY